MAATSSRKRKRGGDYCVAGGPNQISCTNNSYTEGISMHYFPKDEFVRKKWTNFVRKHRKDFAPSNKSCLCSVHFDASCYESRTIPFADLEGMDQPPRFKRYLSKGSVPSKDVAGGGKTEMSTPPSARQRRQILRELAASEVEILANATTSPSLPQESTSTSSSCPSADHVTDVEVQTPVPTVTPKATMTPTNATINTSNSPNECTSTWPSPTVTPTSTPKPMCCKCSELR